MQAIKSKKPPESPAGIEGCGKETIQRWTDDEFRYPPYQEAGAHMVLDANNTEVPLPVRAREKLLMYPPGITCEVFAAARRVQKPIKREDERLSSMGRGYNCGIVSWLINLHDGEVFGQKHRGEIQLVNLTWCGIWCQHHLTWEAISDVSR